MSPENIDRVTPLLKNPMGMPAVLRRKSVLLSHDGSTRPSMSWPPLALETHLLILSPAPRTMLQHGGAPDSFGSPLQYHLPGHSTPSCPSLFPMPISLVYLLYFLQHTDLGSRVCAVCGFYSLTFRNPSPHCMLCKKGGFRRHYYPWTVLQEELSHKRMTK